MSSLKFEINERLKSNADFVSFVQQLPQRFAAEGETVYNKRNVIKIVDFQGQKIVVKRFKRLSFVQRIIYTFFRSSKAKRAFKNALELLQRGVDTPEGLAFAEESNLGMMTYGYFVSAADFNPPIRDLFEPEAFSQPLATAFAQFAAMLHKKGILHHDLNSTNVLYADKGNGSFSFSVIDINRMDFSPEGQMPTKKDCYENLTRFTGRMDLFEFVAKAYAQAIGGDAQMVADLIAQKVAHDAAWRRRKDFTRKLKSFFGKKK